MPKSVTRRMILPAGRRSTRMLDGFKSRCTNLGVAEWAALTICATRLTICWAWAGLSDPVELAALVDQAHKF